MIISIFLEEENINEEVFDSMSCGCSCNCGEKNEIYSVEDFKKDFQSDYQKTYNLQVVKIGESNREEIVERINNILENSGESLRITQENYNFVKKAILPLVSYEDRIIALKNIPKMDAVHMAIKEGKRVKTKTGCC